MARRNPPEVIAKGTTMVLIAEDIKAYNVETGEYDDLTSPDSVLFRIENSAGTTVAEATGQQEGSTNNFNALYTFATAGELTYQAVVTEGSSVGYSLKQRVSVEESIADI